MKTAVAGHLGRPAVLAGQIDRLLRDAKARAFVEHFTDSWLQINTLDNDVLLSEHERCSKRFITKNRTVATFERPKITR